MNRTKKLAVAAFAVFALIGASGCASTKVAGADGAPAPAAEQKVSRALPSYGSMGGYRYRRFAAVAAAS